MNAVAITDTTAQAVTYSVLFTGVAFGAVVPVVPTGALVSGAAAVALYSERPLTVLVVLVVLVVLAVAAAAALLGGLVLFAVCSSGSSRLLARLRRRADPARLDDAHRRLEENGVGVLVVSRLLLGGRIPVMVAAVLVGLSWRWFLAGDTVAVVAWSVAYAVIGILGGTIFDEPWQGVTVAVALVLLISAVPILTRHLAARSPGPR